MRCCGLVLSGVLVTAIANAQQATVSLPIVNQFTVNTTVSVPDRGSINLGGLKSASSVRQEFGPIPAGVPRAEARSAGTVSATVYIHDFAALERELLGQTPEQLLASRQAERSPTQAEERGRFEALAQKAERAGKPGVAKLHWQYAAKLGSERAKKHLNGVAAAHVSR